MSLIAAGTLASSPVMAQELDVSVTNLTNAIYMTPLIVVAHDESAHIYQPGMAASTHLQALAEGGDISGISSDFSAVGADIVENPASGLLEPGQTTSFNMNTSDQNKYLSLASMMLPTNEGFVGANDIKIPLVPGVYTYFLNAYDAGTEANNEVINGGGAPGVLGIPADPGAHSGTGATGVTITEENTHVHIHRGAVGDNNATGGESGLTNHVHRWLNPVAKLVITVK